MDSILTGIGILLFIVGLVLGIVSGIGLVHSLTASNVIAPTPNYLIDAVIAIAFMAIGVLMVILGIKKF
jgi:hypothetical protein